MPTVRDLTWDVLRRHGVTTVFGNPGYTELPFLAGLPDDFRYVLGLQEAAVIAMADGFAQATRRPVLVNLHSAPGLGNAIGNLKTAWHNRTPLIVTAGQQRRDMMLGEPGFFARDARDLPKPYVKWSHEPARAADVPAAFERAILLATQAPAGPVFLSVPFDDWLAEAEPSPPRRVSVRAAPDPAAIAAAAARLVAARRPALIVGAAVDRAGAWDDAVTLAERLGAEAYSAPVSSRAGFPEDHSLFRGGLPFARAALRQRLDGHDLIVVAGAAVFDYEPSQPGPVLPDGAALIQLTEDPDEASRAAIGDSVVGDLALSIRALIEAVPKVPRQAPAPLSGPSGAANAAGQGISADDVFAALERVRPADSIVVLEAPSHASAMHRHVRIRRSGGYYNEGVGGLGFGLPCAVGVQLAEPGTRVIAAVGDGSLLYAVQALWTAVQQGAPVTVLVLDNGGYVVLKESGDFLGVGHGKPPLDVPGLDHLALAAAFGARGIRVTDREQIEPALREALASAQPMLVSIAVDPGVRLLLS